ncbi:hypothetical protein F441_04552, partial [Phytophthora nicotianae CJ01A1]
MVRRVISEGQESVAAVPLSERRQVVKDTVTVFRYTVTRAVVEDADLQGPGLHKPVEKAEVPENLAVPEETLELEQKYDEKVPKWLYE